MYNINPDAANTKDLGLNQGASQIFNPLPYIDEARKNKEFDERQKALKQAQKDKEEEARQAKLEGMLNNVKDGINPRDRDIFVNLHKDLNNGVLADIDKLKAGDPAAWARFNTALSNARQEADNSNAAYKDYLAQKSKVEADPNGYYPESKLAFDKWNNLENAGVYDAAPIPQKIPKIAPDQYILARKKDMMTTADSEGHPLIKDISRQEADKEALNMLNNPEYTTHFFRQTVTGEGNTGTLSESDLNKLSVPSAYDAKGKPISYLLLTHNSTLLQDEPDKYAPATPENVAKATAGKSLEGHFQKQPPASSQGPASQQVNLVLTKDKEGNITNADPQFAGGGAKKGNTIIPIDGVDTEVQVTNAKGTPENPYVTVKAPLATKDNEVKKKEFDKARTNWGKEDFNFKQKLNKQFPDGPPKITDPSNDQEVQRASEYYQTISAWHNDHPYPKKPDYEVVEQTLSGDRARRAWSDAYKMPIENALTGKGIPAHVTVFHSKEDQPAESNNSDSGQLFEYNGHSATKQEWLKSGWTEAQLLKYSKKK